VGTSNSNPYDVPRDRDNNCPISNGVPTVDDIDYMNHEVVTQVSVESPAAVFNRGRSFNEGRGTGDVGDDLGVDSGDYIYMSSVEVEGRGKVTTSSHTEEVCHT
jgi:hypothetical protein